MGLNPAQRNSVTIALRVMEQTLANLTRQAGRSETGILYQSSLPLSNGERDQMQTLVEAARREIAALAERLQLEATKEDGRCSAAAHLSDAWTMPEDIRPAKLSRYGKVDPDLLESLEPGLDRLITLSLALERLLASEG